MSNSRILKAYIVKGEDLKNDEFLQTVYAYSDLSARKYFQKKYPNIKIINVENTVGGCPSNAFDGLICGVAK